VGEVTKKKFRQENEKGEAATLVICTKTTAKEAASAKIQIMKAFTCN
jgi:hypothetical protein